MFNLPKELQDLIYSFDNTHKSNFDNVLKEYKDKIDNLNGRNLFTKMCKANFELEQYEIYNKKLDNDIVKYLIYKCHQIRFDYWLYEMLIECELQFGYDSESEEEFDYDDESDDE